MIVQAELADLAKRPDPTPVEIREHCLRFQDSWSRRERRKRAGVLGLRWEAPVVVLSGVEE